MVFTTSITAADTMAHSTPARPRFTAAGNFQRGTKASISPALKINGLSRLIRMNKQMISKAPLSSL